MTWLVKVALDRPYTFIVMALMILIFGPLAAVQAIYFLWRPFLRDAGDDMVLEVAVAARCTAIVTFNGKDFVGVEPFGLRVLTPHQFLKQLE